MTNPLLNPAIINYDINFDTITPEHFKEVFPILIKDTKEEHERVIAQETLTYDGLFENLPKREQLNAVLNILSNLNAVVQTPDIRDVYNAFLPEVMEMFQEMSLDERAYKQIKKYEKTKEYSLLPQIKKNVIKDLLKNYELGGINLPQDKKKQLQEITVKLSDLMNKFEDNLKDVEANLEMTLTNEELEGLPERCYQNMETVQEGDVLKYKATDNSGVYDDILSYCDKAETRKKVYEQRLFLGIAEGYDNRPLVRDIVKLKQEKAKILNFKNYAYLSLEDNMVNEPEKALSFITQLAEKSYKIAKKEVQEVNSFGEKILGYTPDFPDRGYVVTKMEKELFSVDEEKLRKYFPVDYVVSKLFTILETLYEIRFVKNEKKSVWHEDVQVYDVSDIKTQKYMGSIYMDLYKRKYKSSGAWMNPMSSKHVHNDKTTLPITYLVCNAPKDLGQESTFTFDEVVTLFHEMGHTLHNLLSEVEIEYFSGLNNVEHDAIELPSQFMENFCWDYEILKEITSHIETKEVLPFEDYEKMLSMKNFLSANATLRQSTFALMDMRIYNELDKDPLLIEREVFEQWKTRALDSRSCFLSTFTHIFTGGYSAGYYAYKWSEVLSSDAFAALKEAGKTYKEQKEAANKFRQTVLARGGSKPMAENFLEFRGREPDIKYLLQDSGII